MGEGWASGSRDNDTECCRAHPLVERAGRVDAVAAAVFVFVEAGEAAGALDVALARELAGVGLGVADELEVVAVVALLENPAFANVYRL
jgi:hypothetical protein